MRDARCSTVTRPEPDNIWRVFALRLNRWDWMMPDTVHSLSTSGLAPKRQIQCWTDALTELCGHFDIDPMEASSFEGQVN